jgi:hemerythrin-like domain-containing protein
VEPLLDDWEHAPTTARGRELADLVDRLAAALFEHLDLEEREILPLALRHVTVAEWNSLGEQGIEEMDRKQLPILFGAILEECTPEERRAMLAKLPLPVRIILRSIGARQYRRYVTRVRGR